MTALASFTRRSGLVLAATTALLAGTSAPARADHISVSIQRLAASLDQASHQLAQDIQCDTAYSPFGPRLAAHSSTLCRATHHLYHTALAGGSIEHLRVDLAEVIAAQHCLANALNFGGATSVINRDMIQMSRVVNSFQMELQARAFSVPSSPYAYPSAFSSRYYVPPYPGRITIAVGGRHSPRGW